LGIFCLNSKPKQKKYEQRVILCFWEFLIIPEQTNRTEQCSVLTQRKQKKSFAEYGVSATQFCQLLNVVF